MRGSAFIAFFGIAAAISGSLIGCGDDDGDEETAAPKVTKSKSGESCLNTNDCDKGLACFSNVCLEAPAGTGGTDGTGGSTATGGKGGTGSTLGGVGESCTRRADCSPGLGCYNQRCAMGATGEGGGGNTPTVGGPGETCQLSSDCDDGLTCLPGGANATPGLGFTGVCTSTDTGLAPTGKVCGAECTAAADCCELPVEMHTLVGPNVKSCADLEDALTGVNCDAANLAALPAARCFANSAYCSCSAAQVRANWECTAGQCIYHADCSADGPVPGGCAPFSRSGRALTSTCDIGESDTCAPTAGTPYCEDAADCDTKAVSDDAGDTCNADECVCYQNTCLRACSEDLDCRAGYFCDSDSVCKPQNGCTDNLECVRSKGDIRWTCGANHVCTLPCEDDLDCNPGGFVNGNGAVAGPFTMVCEANQCVELGCSNDGECPGAANGTRLFCTAPTPGTAGAVGQSAITD